MSNNIASIVDLIHPTASGIGIVTSDTVWVLFDREIDETTVENGNLFVTGPDFDSLVGPGLQLFHDAESIGDEEEILQSPGYHGFLQGDITFERIDPSSLTTVTTTDTVGSGLLYRSKAILTPTNRLQANTTYQVYLSGDEDDTDAYQTGISSRTVFDPVASGTNIGTGDVSFEGGYTGALAEDTYRIAVTTSGELGDSRFTFVRDSDPLSVYGPFKTKRSGVLLSDGVTVEFDEGIYGVGDQWSVVVKERDVYSNNLTWPFKTGSGSITTLPDTTATSVIGDPAPTGSGSSSTIASFSVSSTTPDDEATNQTLIAGPYDITVEFDASIDATTVVSGVDVTVVAESVTGEPDVEANGTLIAEPSVSGSTLTITVASGQLYENNLVSVTLDSTIANVSGTSLGTDYTFWFTTEFNPLYCAMRQTRVRIGAFISDVSDNTVNLANHMASKEAGLLTWNGDNSGDDYYQFIRQQWTCCRGAQMLLINTTGGAGALKSKKLGDLEVSYNTSTDINKPLQSVEDCLAKFEGGLLAGGQQVQDPVMAIRGADDVDRPPIGRGWLHTRDIHNPTNPIGNRRLRPNTSKRFRNVFTRQSFAKGWWDRG